ATWKPATLGRDKAKYAWRLWEHTWTAGSPGSYLIMSRAKDSTGRVQPMVAAWNPSGYQWDVADKGRRTIPTGSRDVTCEEPVKVRKHGVLTAQALIPRRRHRGQAGLAVSTLRGLQQS